MTSPTTSKTTRPPTTALSVRPVRRPARGRGGLRAASAAAWGLLSIALCAGLWELAWALGWVNVLTLPPPHVFLRSFPAQAAFFSDGSGSPVLAVLSAMGATVGRVLLGLLIGFVASLVVGLAITQLRIAQRLLLPLVTLLAPISPMAWLPISIFLFGVGNGPAVFMVIIGIFFMMTLATIADVLAVNSTYHQVARTLGANRPQLLFQVVLPAILPGLLRTARLNLFAAWMMVLVAEAVGVGQGLGQVIMLARNTFNSSLVFFTMTIIGVSGYVLDTLFRTIQRRILWWDAPREGNRR